MVAPFHETTGQTTGDLIDLTTFTAATMKRDQSRPHLVSVIALRQPTSSGKRGGRRLLSVERRPADWRNSEDPATAPSSRHGRFKVTEIPIFELDAGTAG
ncbi:hypothetical protein C5748_09745 [Phyllobacterium phragmitis]|uniref:Uncharacterized protein n=1 Tax=Phyllobacterium phragmitis TaxID=2670329 RepID=A0A2S9ISP8_9HYPH|nr:hypothetical protein C5748_09745 [Phyllobacterium phragmitis]